MLEILICDKDRQHNESLKDICFRYAFQENIDSEIHILETRKEIEAYMKKADIKLLMILGTSILKERQSAEEEQAWGQNYIILMADTIQEVMEAVTPSIRPSGLLLKPAEKMRAEQLLEEIWRDYKRNLSAKELFVVRLKNREYAIARDSILFFESRNKKIVVRTLNQELEFYDTLDKIKERIGGSFMRVHKSFLVNMEQVEMIHFSNMTIHFKGDVFALLSRSYKAKVMEEWKKREAGK